MYITAKMLRKHRACEDQFEVFKKEWPNGVEVTEEACLRAAELGLDIGWAAREFLTDPHLKAYDRAIAPHWEAYQEAVAPHWKAYQEATAPHWEAYEKEVTPHWKAYQEATAPHWEAYEKEVTPHWKAYQEAKAIKVAKICQGH